MGNISKQKKLTGADYLHMPIPELVEHPDFNQHAYRVIQRVLQMTSAQLVELDVLKTRL